MKKFIFFFILSFYLYSQDKETKKILKHIKFLSQRRIIENIQINGKEILNKRDFINTLYRLLKSLDRSKVSKEDLNIIENMLYEITNFINKFKVEIDDNIKRFSNLKEEFNKLKEDLLTKIEENLSKIDVLERNVKSYFEMESSLKEFLKEFKVNFSSDLGVFSNLDSLNFRYNIFTKISKKKSNFKFLYDKEFEKDSNIIFKGEVFPTDSFSFYFKNYSHTFLSAFNEIFYADYENYSKIIGIKRKDILDICVLEDNNFNLLSNIDIKYFFLSTHFKKDDLDSSIRDKFLEIGTKLPLFKDTFWIGASLIREDSYFANFYLAYLSEFLNLKFYYKDNFSFLDRKRKLKINSNYIFSKDFTLGVRSVINFPNLDPTFENILESWEFFINTNGKIFNLNLAIKSDKVNEKNEIFGVATSTLSYSNFSLKIGSILKDPIENNLYRLCIFLRGEYLIYDHLNLYLQYIKSNFEYKNNEINLEGQRYNILFSKIRETIHEKKYGTLFFGFKLNI